VKPMKKIALWLALSACMSTAALAQHSDRVLD